MEKIKNIKIKISDIKDNVAILELSDYIEKWFDSKSIYFEGMIVKEENKKRKPLLNFPLKTSDFLLDYEGDSQ